MIPSPLFKHFFAWTESSVAESQRRGDQLVAALERYKFDHKQYPPNLDALVPEYLGALPLPTAGDRTWRYEPLENGSKFHLRFAMDEKEYPVCRFYSGSEGWYEDS